MEDCSRLGGELRGTNDNLNIVNSDVVKRKQLLKEFKIGELNNLLQTYGIEKTWYSLLAFHIQSISTTRFKYILEHENFADRVEIDKNYLENLTIGEISVLYEYSLAYIDRDSRKISGQYFTPDDVASLMVSKLQNFSNTGVWVDPCSGIGNLSYWLINSKNNKEQFVRENLILIDKDPLSLFIARVLFTIYFQKNNKNLFFDIESNFIVADFLKEPNLPKYDFAILNPPYVVVPPDESFEVYAASDLYAYFLEKVIKTTKGFVSITPQGFTNADKFRSVRNLLLKSFTSINIYAFDNVPDNIFKGIKFGSKNSNKVNSTRAAIMVAGFPIKNSGFYITPLLRWRAHEREDLFNTLDQYLTSVKPSKEVFPKVSPNLSDLYNKSITEKKKLWTIISRRPTSHMLIVPKTPRYFISAVKRDINRTSLKKLFFFTKEEMDFAYLLLNSSFAYWWWRVNDGGMTISDKTLFSLPLLGNREENNSLIKKLEHSEQVNMVSKRNAGKENENIKHNLKLISELNSFLFPEFSAELIKTHNNSFVNKKVK